MQNISRIFHFLFILFVTGYLFNLTSEDTVTQREIFLAIIGSLSLVFAIGTMLGILTEER